MSEILMPSGKIITPDALFVRHRYARNELDVQQPSLAAEGHFKMTVRRADGSLKQETPWFKNLILDAGLDRYLSSMQYVNYFAVGSFKVGTNNTPPAVGQTQLLAQVAQSAGSNATPSGGYSVPSVSPDTPYWVAMRYGNRFTAGSLSGQPLTEVGIGWNSTACFSRALIMPDGVNPGSITVLSDETLDVYYEVRFYPQTTDATGSITLAGTTHNFVVRPTQVNEAASIFSHRQAVESGNDGTFGQSIADGQAYQTATLGTVTGSPTAVSGAANAAPSSTSTSAYSAGSFSRTHSITYGLDRANTPNGNIQVLTYCLRGAGAFQASFSPPIPKGNTKTLRLDFTTTLTRRP